MRVGAVNYLNTKPLIEGLCRFDAGIELSLELPSRLADKMAAGELDVGLIPVVEYFRAGDYGHIPGIGIASRGPVLSVTLFSRVPWASIASVSLDEGSRTSAALTRILLAHRSKRNLLLRQLPIDVPADDVSTDAVLLIGDRAMKACLPGFEYAYDLGEEWTNWTGLPMVFAVWAVRAGLDPKSIARPFEQAKSQGMKSIGAIAAREATRLGVDAGYCRRYLGQIIRYDLGHEEYRGLERFRQLASELGLCPQEKTREHRWDFAESR
jgi:chorismate dehydratase